MQTRAALARTLDEGDPGDWRHVGDASVSTLVDAVTRSGHSAACMSMHFSLPGLAALHGVALWRRLQQLHPQDRVLAKVDYMDDMPAVRAVLKVVRVQSLARALHARIEEVRCSCF